MKMPRLINRKRAFGLVAVTLWTLLQGVAAGAAAFAVRGLFESLHSDIPLPTMLLAMLAGSGVVIALSRVAASVAGERIGHAYALEVRHALFRHATRMPASDVAMRRNGYMSLRFVGDLSALRDWLGLGLPHLIAALILIPVAQWVLWSLHPGFGRAVIPFFVFGFVVIGLGGFLLVPMHRKLRHRRARIAADMAERMPLAPHLGRMGRTRIETDQISKHSYSMIDAALAKTRLSEVLKALPDVLSALAVLTVIWIGYRDDVTTGTIAGALSALGIAFFPMRELATVWNLHAGFRAAHSKCENALGRRQRPHTPPQRSKAEPFKVEIHNLTCGSLENFSLTANAGEITTLSGVTSHQKVQLFSVLSGLEIPESGTVRMNGTALAEVDQSRVAVVTAHPPVLRGSLRRAVTLGLNPRPKAKKIKSVARRTGFDKAIERLGGLDAQLAEGGKNLSISERAQLSLTRAMLSQPGLVLITRSARVLDKSAQATMMAWIKKTGATALFRA